MQVQGLPMAPIIEVERVNAGEFRVRVSEGRSETSHAVTVPPEYYQRLAGGKTQPEELIKRSFEFLLERESKESILRRFELPAIARYFPEYEREIKRRL
jgi:hypothetical protein